MPTGKRICVLRKGLLFRRHAYPDEPFALRLETPVRRVRRDERCVTIINKELPNPTPTPRVSSDFIVHVSIGDLAMHSFGKEVQQPRDAAGHSPALLQVVVALRQSQLHDGAAASAGTPSNRGQMGSSQASLSVGADGDVGGVLAIDMPKFDDELPALDVRVSRYGLPPKTTYWLDHQGERE